MTVSCLLFTGIVVRETTKFAGKSYSDKSVSGNVASPCSYGIVTGRTTKKMGAALNRFYVHVGSCHFAANTISAQK